MINVVLIGYGYWGHILEKYLKLETRINLVKIFRGREDRKVINTTLSSENIDAVFIATPLETHYGYVKLGIENNKHIFCEKPVTNNLKLDKELFNLSKNNNCCLFIDYIYRYSKSIQYVKNNIDIIGKIKCINMKIKQFGKFYNGETVTEIIGVHMISILVYLFEKEFESTISIMPVEELYQKNNNIYRFSKLSFGEVNIYIEESLFSLRKERSFEIIGEKGIIFFDMYSSEKVKIISGEWGNNGFEVVDEKSIDFDENNNLTNSISNFCDILEKNQEYKFIKQNFIISKILDLYKKIY